jgi:hypothetical protein
MVMSGLRRHSNLDRMFIAVAVQISAGKIVNASLDAIVDGGV